MGVVSEDLVVEVVVVAVMVETAELVLMGIDAGLLVLIPFFVVYPQLFCFRLGFVSGT